MTDAGKKGENKPETILATIPRGAKHQVRVTQIGEGDNSTLDLRLFKKRNDYTWLPTKEGVRFLKKEVKTLVEALAKVL